MNKKKLSSIIVILFLAGCGGSDGTGSMGSVSARTSVAYADSAATPASAIDSAQFLMSTYQDGLSEIQLSRLALQKAANDYVKRFAQRMINDHTRLNNDLMRLARSKNITLPTDISAEQKTQADRLAPLSGDEFDRAYMALNVEAHEKDVVAARQQARQGNDPDVKALADASLPILEIHFAAAEGINTLLDPAAFLIAAYQDGLAEIQISRLALQKATDDDVKSFAQRMIDNHTQLNNAIAAVAKQKGVTLPDAPTPEQQDTAAQLAKFSGTDFDKRYMDENVVDHVKDVLGARLQSEEGRDSGVRNLARVALPVLSEHLARALDIDKHIEPSFLYSAYQDGKAEIRLAYLALQQGSNGQVKSFAQRMITDHAALNTRIAQLAQQKNLALPDEMSPEQLLAFVRLMNQSGAAFDREYMDLNVQNHKKDVEQATQQSQNASDADIKTLAQNGLPVLNEHLTLATQLQQQLNASAQH